MVRILALNSYLEEEEKNCPKVIGICRSQQALNSYLEEEEKNCPKVIGICRSQQAHWHSMDPVSGGGCGDGGGRGGGAFTGGGSLQDR